MGRELLAETVTRKAGFCSCKTCTSTVRGGRMRVRAPWMGSLRVSASSYRFMSRLYNHWLIPTILPFVYNNILFNGTAVFNYIKFKSLCSCLSDSYR